MSSKANISVALRCVTFCLIIFATLALPLHALAQSCALCYTQAASAGQKMIEALRDGILVLVIPPTLGSVGMLFVVYRRRNQIRRNGNEEQSSPLGW